MDRTKLVLGESLPTAAFTIILLAMVAALLGSFRADPPLPSPPPAAAPQAPTKSKQSRTLPAARFVWIAGAEAAMRNKGGKPAIVEFSADYDDGSYALADLYAGNLRIQELLTYFDTYRERAPSAAKLPASWATWQVSQVPSLVAVSPDRTKRLSTLSLGPGTISREQAVEDYLEAAATKYPKD